MNAGRYKQSLTLEKQSQKHNPLKKWNPSYSVMNHLSAPN